MESDARAIVFGVVTDGPYLFHIRSSLGLQTHAEIALSHKLLKACVSSCINGEKSPVFCL